MKIQTAKAAAKVLEAMDQKMQQRMNRAIKAIPDGDIRPLIGTRSLFRLRVGNWRIVFYYLDDETIWIEKIASRGDAYKGGLLH